MLKTWLLIFAFILLSGPDAYSQKNTGIIRSTIVSFPSRESISDVTVSLVNETDSTIERMTVSDNRGHFILRDIRLNTYKLILTEINHEPLVTTVMLTGENSSASLDTLWMKPVTNRLEMVTIIRQLPIVFKKDTIEFHAGSFKTREHDLVEDLLKKLPGIEVARDGSLMANGEKVHRVLVDGKPFFGSDPKMATQNLPADIIDKVQVIDHKSEQARLTGVEGGQVEKVINITIKKNRNRGSFGRAYAGYGTDDRYEVQLSGNAFMDQKRISFVGGSGNTGRTESTDGISGGNLTTNAGLSQDVQLRTNFSNTWNNKFTVTANLAFIQNQNESEQWRNRQTILGDSLHIYREQSRSTRDLSGYSGGLHIDYNPNASTRISFDQSANLYWNTYESDASFLSAGNNERRINEGSRKNKNQAKTPAFNGSFSFSRSFKKPRRALIFNWGHSFNNSLTEGWSLSENYFYPLNAAEQDSVIHQYSAVGQNGHSIQTSLSYNEPLTRKSSFSIMAAYTNGRNASLRETFDFHATSGYYDQYNVLLSNDFYNHTNNITAGIHYIYTMKNSNLTLGASWQKGETRTASITKDSIYLQKLSGLVPRASYTFYKRGRFATNLSVHYNFDNSPPHPMQLQPVIDISNPMFLRYGNPLLKYSTTHRASFTLSRNHLKKGFSLTAGGSYNTTVNSIATLTRYDGVTGVQSTMPVNVNGVSSGTGRIYLSGPLHAWGARNRWFASTNAQFGRNISFVHEDRNISNSLNHTVSAGFSFDVREVLHLRLGYSMNTQSVKYSLRREQNNRTVMRTMNTDLRLTPGKFTELSISWDYKASSGRAAGFNNELHMVNAELTRYMGKKKDFWLKFRVYDLLEENVNVYRYSGENFFEDTETNILGRYFLFSLNLRLNKFKEE